MKFPALLLGCLLTVYLSSCVTSRSIASAEEYYALGMAYFELGKYAEADVWLNRARSVDKTKTASEYNLGRIAFETGRYNDALGIFERILAQDPDNVLALKAAAYTSIKLGNLERAETLYERVQALVPDSADDGYNYAMVLFALEKPERTEEVLRQYPYALDEQNDALLLLARSQRAQNKVEAADSYNQWLLTNTGNPKVRYEYAQVLEEAELYARALEEYRQILTELQQQRPSGQTAGENDLKPSSIRFTIARLLLIADPENDEAITELETALDEGFTDMTALEALTADERISTSHREAIRLLIEKIEDAQKAEEEAAAGEDDETETDLEGSTGGSV